MSTQVSEPMAAPLKVRRPWVVLLVVAVMVPALALSALSTWHIWSLPSYPVSAGAPLPDTGGAATPGSTKDQVRSDQERAILKRRANAVLSRNEAMFLQDLDPSRPALRAQQRAIFRGLGRLRFSAFRYSLASVDLNQHAADQTAGRTRDVQGVESLYSLAGYDTGNVVEAQAVTFVLKGGHWVFESDRSEDDQLPAAGHAEPWDDGEVGVAKGHHCLVIGQVADQPTLRKVARSVDEAVAADTDFWPVGSGHKRWDGRVVVYVPRANREFTSLFRGSTQSADGVVAVAIRVYDGISWSKNGRAYGDANGTRVIINPKYFKPSTRYFSVILRHEVSHIAAEPITASGTPSWLVEGLAEYVGWRQPDPARTFYARGVDARTADAINARTYRMTFPSSRSFYRGSNATISQHYTDGFLVCAYIQHRYGEGALKTFAKRMGAARTDGREPAVLRSAVHKTFGVTPAQLRSAGTAWLRGFTISR